MFGKSARPAAEVRPSGHEPCRHRTTKTTSKDVQLPSGSWTVETTVR